MGFSLASEQGLPALEEWLKTRSYVDGYAPSQADVAVSKAITYNVSAAKYPHVTRWRRHIKTFEDEFSVLRGDASKPHTAYGPAAAAAAEADDDEDVDLFGSDDEEEDAEAEKIREQRLAEYAAKKAGKTKPAAKSVVTMEVKPWDDETDMKALEAGVRGIEMDGLVWGASKLVPVGYGIRKLQITLVVEDEKVSLDELQEQIQEQQEDYVQSTDIAAMQKL